MADADLAFVFPGQGSQKVGMLAEAREAFPIIDETLAEASDVLDYDVLELVEHGPQEQLNLTETTQPVLLASSIALWRAWFAEGGTSPGVVAGHSLGEFSALVAAGSLQFNDALRLVRLRGQYMQSAVPVGEGAMAAIIGLDDDVITAVCATLAAERNEVVSAVNFNSPGQVVIAGHAGAVEAAIALLKEAGARRALPLPVSAPFHTSLMAPAGERLAEALADTMIDAPQIPVIHNVHACAETDPERIRALLVEQIASPVLWTSCVRALVAAGATHVVECGPGKVLSGLNKRIDKTLRSTALDDPDALLEIVRASSTN